ncbi:uncharacterized protein BJ212DRAFT_1480055 [Suillus subaureus]|uniref:Uncharacterized protein n=1 Tax=Suillus subaureus TaxID=48587 RepID=A0A9P7EC01_9AGAM|nr:uncharacterized protein BJ212DRAFT_1480055 [Suillus subaureus]KAG1817487.1 hypothetical protein BJ212DRAFT_1480055 [Suillus subaureus]
MPLASLTHHWLSVDATSFQPFQMDIQMPSSDADHLLQEVKVKSMTGHSFIFADRDMFTRFIGMGIGHEIQYDSSAVRHHQSEYQDESFSCEDELDHDGEAASEAPKDGEHALRVDEDEEDNGDEDEDKQDDGESTNSDSSKDDGSTMGADEDEEPASALESDEDQDDEYYRF